MRTCLLSKNNCLVKYARYIINSNLCISYFILSLCILFNIWKIKNIFDNKFCYFYSNTLIIVLPNIFFKYQFSCISLLSWSTKVDFYQSEFLISKWIGRIIAHGFTYLQINDFHEIQKKILQRILMKPQYTVK